MLLPRGLPGGVSVPDVRWRYGFGAAAVERRACVAGASRNDRGTTMPGRSGSGWKPRPSGLLLYGSRASGKCAASCAVAQRRASSVGSGSRRQHFRRVADIECRRLVSGAASSTGVDVKRWRPCSGAVLPPADDTVEDGTTAPVPDGTRRSAVRRAYGSRVVRTPPPAHGA